MQDLEGTPVPVAIPPAPVDRPARRRPAVRPVAVVVLVSWAVAGSLVWHQRVEVDRARSDADRATAELRAQIASLTDAQASIQRELDGSFDGSAVVAGASPSVFTLFAGPFQGSAFVLAGDASRSTLVTNFHVVRRVWRGGGRSVVVRAAGRSYEGVLDRVFPDIDIALIGVSSELPVLATDRWGLEVGAPVVALGSPFGWAGTATTGIVSAIRSRFVQFSAPVSPGSSGGPVLDAEGDVVAVTVGKVIGHGVEGLSFAIPIDRVCRETAAC